MKELWQEKIDVFSDALELKPNEKEFLIFLAGKAYQRQSDWHINSSIQLEPDELEKEIGMHVSSYLLHLFDAYIDSPMIDSGEKVEEVDWSDFDKVIDDEELSLIYADDLDIKRRLDAREKRLALENE